MEAQLTVSKTWQSALASIVENEAVYRRLNQLTRAHEEFLEPAEYCSKLLERLATSLNAGDLPSLRPFFTWAATVSPHSSLFYVLASIVHRKVGDTGTAAALAQRAKNLYSRDLYAQELYRTVSLQTPEKDLSGRFCNAPFDNVETAPNGDVHFCCPAWLPVPIGNLHKHSIENIWNSPHAQTIRESILDGSYRYCSRVHCPRISGGTLEHKAEVSDEEHREIILQRKTRLSRGPLRVVFSHDRSCNLSCPSCRIHVIVAKKHEQSRLNRLADAVLIPMLKNTRRLHVTSSGDPFGSIHFRYLLKCLNTMDFPDLRVDLQTNGVLFDEDAWEKLELEGLVESAFISIDAAREPTYAVLRRGGSFSRLMSNLLFISELRQAGRLKRVRLDAVVQRLNFRELPDIVDIARRLKFDGVKFQMIRSWGTYTPDEFASHHIGSPAHPNYDEFLEVLKDPRLGGKFVQLWGMEEALDDARARDERSDTMRLARSAQRRYA